MNVNKVNEKRFNVDFTYPVSPYQAFGIVIAIINQGN